MKLGVYDTDILKGDSDFVWFDEGYAAYTPAAASVEIIARDSDTLSIVVYGGTWCGDTRDHLPTFCKVMDAAHIRASQIRIYLMDRTKKSADVSADQNGIVSIPTFLIMRNGKELGRVVETPVKSIEDDMANIILASHSH